MPDLLYRAACRVNFPGCWLVLHTTCCCALGAWCAHRWYGLAAIQFATVIVTTLHVVKLIPSAPAARPGGGA